MRILGLVLRKGNLFYAVLEGETRHRARIVKVNRAAAKRTTTPSILMDWYDHAFRDLIDHYRPDIVVHETADELSAQEAPFEIFPLGVLNLMCHRRQVMCKSRAGDYITSVRKRRCKEYFYDMELQLFDPELDAVILAWHEM